MSGADDLRNLVADVVCRYEVRANDGHSAQGLLIDDIVTVLQDPGWGVSYGDGLTDGISALLATAKTDPVRRLAILDAMGLDVTEGCCSKERYERRKNTGILEVVHPAFSYDDDVFVLVVRPKDAPDV